MWMGWDETAYIHNALESFRAAHGMHYDDQMHGRTSMSRMRVFVFLFGGTVLKSWKRLLFNCVLHPRSYDFLMSEFLFFLLNFFFSFFLHPSCIRRNIIETKWLRQRLCTFSNWPNLLYFCPSHFRCVGPKKKKRSFIYFIWMAAFFACAVVAVVVQLHEFVIVVNFYSKWCNIRVHLYI